MNHNNYDIDMQSPILIDGLDVNQNNTTDMIQTGWIYPLFQSLIYK